MDQKYIMALDQGTTSSRTVIFDEKGRIVASAQKEFPQYFPQDGWVEQDPFDIIGTQFETIGEAMFKGGIQPQEIAAVGITNQRETTLVWDRHTGMPVYNAIVWQCRRTAEICEDLKKRGLEPYIRENTGLLPDAYFSGCKIKWILDNVPGVAERATNGDLLFGTVDTYLIWHLTGKEVHATDYTNASRTMLFNIKTLQWDQYLLDEIGIPNSMLPEVRPSSGFFGNIKHPIFAGNEIPITGVAGDQQAALFGHGCVIPGSLKNTYGTGCFLLMHTGNSPTISEHGLLTTLTADTAPNQPQYALEGSVFTAGSVIQWLRDGLKIIDSSAETDALARKVENSGGVYLVPAFTGLGAPYWDMYARGAIFGLTRAATREHIVRAALESIAFQSHDVMTAMQSDCRIKISHLRVDGGACANDFLMQFQADIADCEVRRPAMIESTAYGAAALAGISIGIWQDCADACENLKLDKTFFPNIDEDERFERLAKWHDAVNRTTKE
jgi:glycerol kinase